jgi:hypothetical protein
VVPAVPSFGQSASVLVGSMDTFNEASRKLADALASFPNTLNVQSQGRVAVVRNGGGFAKLLPAINEAVQGAVQDQLNSIFTSAFPEAGITRGN